MKLLSNIFIYTLMATALTEPSHATTDATCLIYQPIDMRSEGTVISLPENGFIILAIPYSSGFSVSEKPYSAITKPHKMLSMRKNKGTWDSNLISRTGIKIHSNCFFEDSKMIKEEVSIDLSNVIITNYGPSLEVIVEATLECIRRTATDKHQQWKRPLIRIIGKPSDQPKWKRWEKTFNEQDFTKPFKRPATVKNK